MFVEVHVFIKGKDILCHEGPWVAVDARIHVFTTAALGRGSPKLCHLFTPGKVPVLILQETEWTPVPDWTKIFYNILQEHWNNTSLTKKNVCLLLNESYPWYQWLIFWLHFILNHQSVLLKGRSFTANSGTKAAVLPKGRSSTANTGTKVAILLGMNRCGIFPLLSALHTLFSIWIDLKRSQGPHRGGEESVFG